MKIFNFLIFLIFNIFATGYGIFYANYLAHRDPEVFDKPEDFIPERWNGSNSGNVDKIFGFGSGPHRCIGENLMRDVMQFVGKVIFKR